MGFTSWFGGQCIGSDCATWCRAVFIQGLHLGLEDRVLVLIVPLGAVLSNTGLHLGLEDRVLLLIVPLGAVLSSYGVYILVWRTGHWF